MQTVRDLGEAGLLARLEKRLGRAAPGVIMGAGDDAALLRQIGPQAVLTCDLLVENVDFRRTWATPADIGHKAAAVNISDLAAMGARPRGLLAGLALRGDETVADVLTLLGTLDRIGRRYGAPLVGGDLSYIDGPMVVSVTAVGEVQARQALARRAARPGDAVLVSGSLGGAAAGLRMLMHHEPGMATWVRRQKRPTPRVALGQRLAASGKVRACADVSDGLAKDALHLVPRRSGVRIDMDRLPLMPGLARAQLSQSAPALALYGGEDFELVLAAAPRHVPALCALAQTIGERLTVVGQVVDRAGLQLVGGGAEALSGHAYDHFR